MWPGTSDALSLNYFEVICGVGVLLSVPLTLPAIGMAKDEVIRAFILIFVGQIFLNMNWAIIVDVSLVCNFLSLHIK